MPQGTPADIVAAVRGGPRGPAGAGRRRSFAAARRRPAALPRPAHRQRRRGPRHRPARDRQVAAPRLRRGARRRHPGALLRAHRRRLPAAAPPPGRARRCSPRPGSTTTRAASSASSRRGTTRSPWRSRDARGRRSWPATGWSSSLTRRRPSPPCGRRAARGGRSAEGRCCRWSPAAAPSSASRSSPHADYLMFTGSTATGTHRRRPGRRAAQGLLHGARRQERRMLVLPDADLRRTARPRGAVRGIIANGGQLCVTPSACTCTTACTTRFCARAGRRPATP